MAVDSWALCSVVSKFFGLLAMAGVVGGSFSYLLAEKLRFAELAGLRRYLLASAALGWLAVPLYFLLQVGGINQSGLGGMLDAQVTVILLQSAQGEVLALRLLGFALVPAAVWLLAAASQRPCRVPTGYALCGVAVLLLVTSFASTGHTAELLITAKMLLMLHVLAALLWVGALYPLLLLSSSAETVKVQQLLRGFGALAQCMVAALIVAGVYLATQLLPTPAALVTTSYGFALLLKLAGVGCLLLLAALNKFLLVPRLPVSGVTRLQGSIRGEIAVALYVVAVTSWLTTVTGPVSG